MLTAVRSLAMFAAVACVLAFAGCASTPSRVTRANYDRIENGMSEREVLDILGKPTDNEGAGFKFGDIDASGRVMVWEDGDRWISVTFMQGRVSLKLESKL